MKKVHGSNGTKYIECINPSKNKYRVRWDFSTHVDENGNENGVEYYEHELLYKPSLEQIKELVLNGYNKIIDQKILNGFVWNDMQIWLSQENQFNYKAAYDLAVQTGGQNLPIMFKFGSTENPIYYTFVDMETFTDFYIKAMTYINTQLNEGWKLKDNIDWSVYNN